MFRRLLFAFIASSAACVTPIRVTPAAGAQDGSAIWAVITDKNGDHLVFCSARGIIDQDPTKPARCYDFTDPRGEPVHPLADPYVWPKPER